MEGQQATTEEQVNQNREVVEHVREQQVQANTLVDKSFRICTEVKKQLEDMTGGANDLVAFMDKVKRDRQKT